MDKTKQIIFFDLDGTILDNDVRWYQIHKDLAHHYGFLPIDKNEYLHAKKKKLFEKELIQTSNIAHHLIDSYVKKRINSIESQKYLLLDTVRPGIKKLLNNIRNQYKLILVTKRKKPNNCLRQLNNLHLTQYFSKILITKNEEKYSMINKFFTSEDIKNSLFIGDTEDDFKTGKKLHIKTMLVTYGARDHEFIQKLNPNKVVNSVEYLSNTIEVFANNQKK